MSAIEARVVALEARLAAVEARIAGGGAPSASGASVATDDDLDSEWGDPLVKKDPKKWIENGGESYAGCRMSQCPSDYLRMLASLFDWMAAKDEEKKKTYTNKQGKEVPTAPFNRTAAARARGWAKRNAGKVAAVTVPHDATVEEIPF